ncbi:MAG: hypothetical protein JSV16_02425, partial [Candidatus Hydrogenedentota bacterium]
LAKEESRRLMRGRFGIVSSDKRRTERTGRMVMKRCVAIVTVIGFCLGILGCTAEEAAKPTPPVKPGEPLVMPAKVPAKAEVLDWQELVRFVPKPPEGWKAAKPIGSTQRMGPFAVSKVSRMFTKGTQRVEFRMEDLGTNNPYFFMKEPWKIVEKKTADSYTKKLMLGEAAAEESFYKSKKMGLVFLVFERRIQLNISGAGIEDASLLVKMAKGLDLKELKKTLEEKSK